MIDRERKKRNRAIRIFVIDVIMAVSVVAIVLVLVGMVAGWRIGSDLTLEQNGLVQIETVPTGATVTIDKETPLMATTNTSKMLTGGDHEIVLTKDGYESWSKVVTVKPGWLLNLRYPRLFKQNREKQNVVELASLEFLYASPDRKSIVYAKDKSMVWQYVTNLGSEKIKNTELDFSGLFKKDNVDKKQEGDKKDSNKTTDEEPLSVKIDNIRWNVNSDRVLAKTKDGEWLVLALRNKKESVNLTDVLPKFNGYEEATKKLAEKKIKKVAFLNNAGTDLLVLMDNSLLKVNVSEKLISKTPVDEITDFETYGPEVIFVTEADKNGTRKIGLYKDGDKGSMTMHTVRKKKSSLHVGLSEYYGKKYVVFTVGKRLYVYRGDNFATNSAKDMELVAENDLWIAPESLEIAEETGEFFVMRKGTKVVVYDAEVEKYTEYSYTNKKTQWLDGYMLYGVEKGTLRAWDFDGQNVRTLVVDDAANGYDAVVSEDDKYMYYVAKVDKSYVLRREKL